MDKPKKYYVAMTVHGGAVVEIEADNDTDAMAKAARKYMEESVRDISSIAYADYGRPIAAIEIVEE